MTDGGAVGHRRPIGCRQRCRGRRGGGARFEGKETVMYVYGGMMGGFGLLGGGLIWLLVVIVLVLSIAALVKYLRT